MSGVDGQRYVERHFWLLGELAEAVGVAPKRVEELIAAKCAPDAIYVHNDQGWWSALECDTRQRPEGTRWFSPSAAWNLRKALVHVRTGASDLDAAARLESEFAESFLTALQETEDAELAYPQCFNGHVLNRHQALQAAHDEWAACSA
jgi:hypothetical protein